MVDRAPSDGQPRGALLPLAREVPARPSIQELVMLGSQVTEAGASLRNRLWVAAGFAINKALRRMPGRRLRLGPEDEGPAVMNQWFGWNCYDDP